MLKRIISVLVAFIMLSLPIIVTINGQVSADLSDDDMDAWSRATWSEEYGQYTVYSSYTLGYWTGLYDPHTETWIYDFKAAGIASSTGGGWSFGDEGVIKATAFEVVVLNNEENVIFSVLDAPKYVWSVPESSPKSDNINDVSLLLVDLAMTGISNMGVSLTWTLASSLISAMSNGADEYQLTASHIWRLWEWNNCIDECAQHMLFRADITPGESVSIRVYYNVFGYPFELMQTVAPLTYIINAPSVSSSSALSNSENVHTISRDQLQEYASEGMISDDTATRLLSTNENTFYMTLDSVTIVPDDSTESIEGKTSATELQAVIDSEIQRSEMIIHVFERQNDDKANEIVDEQKSRVASLIKIKEELISNGTTDHSTLEERNDYDQFTLENLLKKHKSNNR